MCGNNLENKYLRRDKMKKITQAFKKTAVDFWNDEEAQGMIEYILILVAVVAIVTVAGGKIRDMVTNKAGDLEGQIGDVNF